MSRPDFFTDVCIFPRANGLPGIAVSGSWLAMPPAAELPQSLAMLQRIRVRTIINVCEAEPRPWHQAMYCRLNIAWHHFPLKDANIVVDPRLTTWLLDVYRSHANNDDIILVHCQCGINRSMLAAALLLWHTTPNAEILWPPPPLSTAAATTADDHALIDWMRLENKIQRGDVCDIFTNATFTAFVSGACRPLTPANPV